MNFEDFVVNHNSEVQSLDVGLALCSKRVILDIVAVPAMFSMIILFLALFLFIIVTPIFTVVLAMLINVK